MGYKHCCWNEYLQQRQNGKMYGYYCYKCEKILPRKPFEKEVNNV